MGRLRRKFMQSMFKKTASAKLKGDKLEDIRPPSLPMVSWKRTGGEGTGSTTRAPGISPVICSRARVARVYLFSK